MIKNCSFLALLLLLTLVVPGCANKQPEAGITSGGQRSGYKAESSVKKQNRMYESMERNFRSLAY